MSQKTLATLTSASSPAGVDRRADVRGQQDIVTQVLQDLGGIIRTVASSPERQHRALPRPAEAQSVEPEDALQMSEQHLDFRTLSLIAFWQIGLDRVNRCEIRRVRKAAGLDRRLALNHARSGWGSLGRRHAVS